MAFAWTAQAAPPAKWTIQSLGSIANRGSFANALNNRGDIVGYSSTGISSGFGPAFYHGFLWQNGVMQDAGSPTGEPRVYSSLIAINDHGLAVGASGGYVYAWQQGTWTPLGFVGEPTDINKSGTIVGLRRAGFGWEGWLYRNGVLETLPSLGRLGTQANAINDRGVVAGTTWLPSGEGRAFRYENGVLQELGTLGGMGSIGTDINNRGDIVGRASTGFTDVAFIYDRAGMRPLIDMTTNAYPIAINDRGAVVGTLDYNSASFLFEDGVLTVLEQIPAVQAAGWVRLEPQDINERGWITGSGRRAGSTSSEAFVLMPK